MSHTATSQVWHGISHCRVVCAPPYRIDRCRLLFRDKRRQLHLYDCHKQARTTLLSYCNYVQWVPESDVVVGQNRDNLNVWYNIDQPEKVTVYPIKGEVEEIVRAEGRTEPVRE